ncbi:S9 family peptidase [Burkholderiaceae bacterium DAT-1]|nr:S9 family peptidase [Burkholderiaceae bacterium DAT-1]
MKFPILGLAVSLLAAYLPSNAAGNPPAQDFFSVQHIAQATPSPDGNLVAALIKSPLGNLSLTILEAANPNNVKVIAQIKDTDISSFSWVNNKRLVFSLSDSKGAHNHVTGNLFAVNADGSEQRQLIEGNWNYEQESTGSHLKKRVLPPDYFFYQSLDDNSNDIIIGKAKYVSVDNSFDSVSLYRLNTSTLELSNLHDDVIPPHAADWLLDGRNTPRVVTSVHGGIYKLYHRDTAGGKWKVLQEVPQFSRDLMQPKFIDQQGDLYVTKPNENGISDLFKYDVANQSLSNEPLITLKDFNFNGSLKHETATHRLLGFEFESDAHNTIWIDPDMKKVQARIDDILPNTNNEIECIRCSGAKTFVVEASSDKQPTEYLIYNREKDTMVRIGSSRPNIVPAQMGARDFVRYPARDGMSIPAYVTIPAQTSGQSLPTIVLVHGGPYVRGGHWAWDRDAQFLASRGYAVIQPDFRGSTGYGTKFFTAGMHQWGLTMQDDLADAAQWAIKQGIADPKRIAIMGASYGGYATLMGLIKHPDLFRCGVEWLGVTDINLMFTATWSDASVDSVNHSMKELIGDPVADAEQLKATSPINLADKLKQPLLMAHGAADRRVPIEHGTRFYNEVKKQNANVEWVVYPEAGHGWHLEKDRIDFWTRVDAFLDKHLKQANTH